MKTVGILGGVIVPALVGLLTLGVALMAIFAFIGALLVWPLWNWVMPEIFGLPEVTYMQAWGILLLTSLLFKSTSSSNSSKD